MKVRATFEGLAVVAMIAVALAKDTFVAITGDNTVGKAGPGAVVIGRTVTTTKVANEKAAVETRFKEFIEIKASGALVAGDRIKMAAADGGGIQRVTKWISQTDALAGDLPETLFGVCWKGGADGATVEVLTY